MAIEGELKGLNAITCENCGAKLPLQVCHSNAGKSLESRTRMKLLSLNQIMKTLPPGRCLLQSTKSKNRSTFFTPFFYDVIKNQWFGTTRWYGNNSKLVKIATMKGGVCLWKVVKSKCPILPYNHKVRKILAMKETIIQKRNNLNR